MCECIVLYICSMFCFCSVFIAQTDKYIRRQTYNWYLWKHVAFGTLEHFVHIFVVPCYGWVFLRLVHRQILANLNFEVWVCECDDLMTWIKNIWLKIQLKSSFKTGLQNNQRNKNTCESKIELNYFVYFVKWVHKYFQETNK